MIEIEAERERTGKVSLCLWDEDTLNGTYGAHMVAAGGASSHQNGFLQPTLPSDTEYWRAHLTWRLKSWRALTEVPLLN